jgi:hypothetical protein
LEPVSHLCSRDGSCIEAALVVIILNIKEIHKDILDITLQKRLTQSVWAGAQGDRVSTPGKGKTHFSLQRVQTI